MRKLLGVCHLLVLVFVGLFVLPIAWIIAGAKARKGIWLATGIVGLVFIGLATYVGFTIAPTLLELTQKYGTLTREAIEELAGKHAIYGYATMILDIASTGLWCAALFAAANTYTGTGSTLLRVAGILALIMTILTVGQPAIAELLPTLGLLNIALLALVAIFGGVGFLKAREE